MIRTEGFSLLGLLISLTIIGVLAGGLSSLLFQVQAISDGKQDMIAMRQGARLAINEMAVNLRMAGYRLQSVPEILWEATPTKIAFASDIDNGSGAPLT